MNPELINLRAAAIDPSLYPEFMDEYQEAQNLHSRLKGKGVKSPYQIGPVCSRDHAWELEDLKKVMKEFMAVVCDPEVKTNDYCRLKQAVHSQLKHAP